MQYIYQVVDAETGKPVEKRYSSKRQHFYTKVGIAKGEATRLNNEEIWLSNKFGNRGIRTPKVYKVQRTPAVWEDCE